MKVDAAVAWVLIPLSLALRGPPSAPGGAGSAEAGASPKVGWEFCALPKKHAPSESQPPIPEILHQTYKTAEIPVVYHRSHESWLKQAPGWKHHIWTDVDNRQLIATHYPWFLETYDSYREPIERSDASRYFTLHRYGGVYADLDIEALSDPTQLISGGQDLVLFYDWMRAPEFMLDPHPWEGLGPSIANALMASAPGHKFWEYVFKRLLWTRRASDTWVQGTNPTMNKFEKIFWATGPWFITVAANEYMKKRPEAHAGIIEPKYWSPSEPDPLGGAKKKCDDVAACVEKFPQAITFHHSLGQWLWVPEATNKTSLNLMRSRWEPLPCTRDAWYLPDYPR